MVVSELLTNWFLGNKRDLPWRKTKDPYAIWLSEVILQQTRVEQGLPYYLKYINKYPTVQDLAAASEDEVINLWKGLGYYSRARNLHFTAKEVVNKYSGIFPDNFEDLKKLKGVGEYTAAAIASIAYAEKVPVIDGNVKRVASRFFGIEDPIDKPKTVKTMFEILKNEIQNANPSDFNQGMMELGSLICKPQNPKCDICPISQGCYALRKGKTSVLPTKASSVKRNSRYFTYLIFEHNNKVLIRKRIEKDIWQHLCEFVLVESQNLDAPEQALENFNQILGNFEIVYVSKPMKHILTHRDIFARFIHIKLQEKTNIMGKWVEIEDMKNVSFPVLISNFVERYWNFDSNF